MNQPASRWVRHVRAGADGSNRATLGQGADLHLMRELNRLAVLNCVRTCGPVSRVAIARHTGLSRTTVSSIIDALLHEGIVQEGEAASAARRGGRRPILVHFNAAAGYIVGVDLGRTHLTLILTDLSANIISRRSGPFTVTDGPHAGLARVAAAVRALLQEQGVPWDRVVGIGLGIPGPMDVTLQALVNPPRMPGWDGVPIAKRLTRELHVPVSADNDANMGALGESRYGAGHGTRDLAYIKIATGIGGGLILDGKIYRGSRGSAGEIGHMTIREDGPRCDCGNRGCLEVIAGAQAIVEDARRGWALERSAPTWRPNTGDPEIDIADVVTAAQRGDQASRAALARAGDHIGIALAGLVNLTNPSLILIDGGVARAGELLLEPIRRATAARSLRAASASTRIIAAALEGDAIALGSVATVVDAVFRVAPHSGGPDHRTTAGMAVE
jgi:glucokinase-like ROK family protein